MPRPCPAVAAAGRCPLVRLRRPRRRLPRGAVRAPARGRDRRRRPPLRRPVVRRQRGRAQRAARVHRALGVDPGPGRRRRPDTGRADRPRPRARRAGRVPVHRDRADRGGVEPDDLGLPARRRPPPAAVPRVRAAARPASPPCSGGWRASRGCSTRPARSPAATRPAPVSRLHAEVAAQRIGGVGALARDAVAQAEAAAGDDPLVAELLPELRRAADEAVAALDAFASWLSDEVVPGDRRLGRAGRAAVHPQASPHAPRSGDDRGPGARAGRGGVRRRARRDGPHRARDLARLATRRAGAGRRGRPGPGHARRDRCRPPGGRRAGGLVPRRSWPGSRRSAATGT